MKITKLEHSCLLVEMPAPVNRTALFDPGVMSEPFVDIDSLEFLDDILITHVHPDHMSVDLIQKLVAKFPDVRITTTEEAVAKLAEAGIHASHEPPDGVQYFESPHEEVRPTFSMPEQSGIHYLDLLTDPGDSHSFSETKAVLAMPMTAPWGALVKAVNVILELKPRYVVPIHDWHWKDEAKNQTYASLEKLFADNDIKFIHLQNGQPVVLDV